MCILLTAYKHHLAVQVVTVVSLPWQTFLQGGTLNFLSLAFTCNSQQHVGSDFKNNATITRSNNRSHHGRGSAALASFRCAASG